MSDLRHLRAVLLLNTALLSLALCGCQPPVAQATAEKSAASGESGPQPTRVTPIQPQRKPLVRTIEIPGRVDAYEVTPLFAKVSGYVRQIHVDLGDAITGPTEDKPGAVLCDLDVPELQQELIQKTALVEQAQAEIKQADAAIKVAEALVRSATAHVQEAEAGMAKEAALYAKWKSEFDRVSQLTATGVVTQKVADETKSSLEAAEAAQKEVEARIVSSKAALDEAQAGLEKAQADAVAVRSQLAVTQAEERRVRTMLDYGQIHAPYTGIVVERNVHTGHLIQAGASSQKPLLTVMRIDPIRVVVDVPEADAGFITKGSKVELKVAGQPVSSTITRCGWSLNSTSRTLTAEIDVPNPEGKWRPGQYVPVKIIVAELTEALSLPRTAIVSQDKQTYCYVIGSDNSLIKQPIQLGIVADGDLEVRSGLSGDERVIGSNVGAFREGQTVEILVPEPTPPK